MIKSISLAKLTIGERNVRRSSDPAADAQLAADIAARGLLQNLVVTPARPRGTYAVEAGGRRLRALQALQQEEALPDDHKVPCLVLGERDDGCSATEASLAENLQRLAMNPADECLAFGKLIEEGADVEGVARRFGLTVRHVEGRLRLAGLHPTVFEALGAGEITLDAAKAYATTSDQERQLWVYEQLHDSWGGAHPDSIRRMMVSATVPASDRRLKYVGEEAYIAAGGRLERDLFAEADDARVLDIAILEQLATDKLEVEAAWLANEHGYGFVRASLDTYVQSWGHEDLRRASLALPEPGEQERERVEKLQAEIDALAEVLEDEDTEDFARDEAEAKIAELDRQLRDIASKPPVLDPEVRGSVGFFLLLDESGTPRLDRTPYALVADDADCDGADDTDAGGESTGGANGNAGSGGSPASGSGATGSGTTASTAAPAKPKLSQRLVEELAMQRRDILALHVAGDPELAFDLAVFLMVRDEGGYCYDSAGSSLSARPPSDPVLRSAMPEAPVNALLAQSCDALDRSWTEHETLAAKFDAFRALPRPAREAWLGAAVARTLEASAGAGGRPCGFHDHLGTLLEIDVAQHWRPTAFNWFDRVPKALCLAALSEVGASELAARHGKSKKAEVAEACEKLFAGEGIVEPQVKAAALAWVPEAMRFAAQVPVDTEKHLSPPWSADEAPAGGHAAAPEGHEELEDSDRVETGAMASVATADEPETDDPRSDDSPEAGAASPAELDQAS
jgi:ParB family chromosome partitioning protein